jgi:hypothetical protein
VLTGCVVKEGGSYRLCDEASAMTVELRVTRSGEQVGQRVQVSGANVLAQPALVLVDEVMRARARTAPKPDSAGAGTTAANASGVGVRRPGDASRAGGAAAATGDAGTAGAAAAGAGVSTAVIAV